MKSDEKLRKRFSSSPQNAMRRRFLILTAIAIILIVILIWLTLTVLEANDIEPFAEVAQLFSDLAN